MRKPLSNLTARAHESRVHLSFYKSTPFFTADAASEFESFRIYRQAVDFTFGLDYEEYFLGLDGEDAEPIYDGPLDAHNDRRYTFTDESTEHTTTYAYYVETKTSGRIGPIPVRVRDPEVWWSLGKINDRLAALCDRSEGRGTVQVCGQSAMGRDMPCLTAGSDSAARTLGLVGLIHGGESGPELIIPAVARLIHDVPELLDNVRIVAIPTVNVDAREDQVTGTPWYLRKNAQGVDINRNFPAQWDTVEYGYGLDSSDPTSGTYRGPNPLTAPEAAAVVNVFEAHPPDVVFCYHSLASISGLPALTTRYGEDDAVFAAHCRELVNVFGGGLHPELEPAENWLAFKCSAGSLPAWLHERFDAPAFDLEAGVDADALARCRIDATDRTLLADYQTRHARAIRRVVEHLASRDLAHRSVNAAV